MLRWALIVVDVQLPWVDEVDLPRAAMERALARARSEGDEVVHVRSAYAGSPHVPFFSELNPEKALDGGPVPAWALGLPGETVVAKSCFDGFRHTGLKRLLRKRGIAGVRIMGLVTSACVLCTAFGAFHRGFRVRVLAECCADRRRERHDAVFALYAGYVFEVERSEDAVVDDQRDSLA